MRRWLYKIVKNVYLDNHAATRTWMSLDAHDLDSLAHKTSQGCCPCSASTSEPECDDFIAKQLTLLPEWQRALLYLFSEGYTYEEMAGILDIPVGTVMTGLFRAREKFRVIERRKNP